MRRDPARWATRFGSWVSSYTVAALARDLAPFATSQAVYSWLAGRNQPRLAVAERIVALSEGSVALEDIAAHRREVMRAFPTLNATTRSTT